MLSFFVLKKWRYYALHFYFRILEYGSMAAGKVNHRFLGKDKFADLEREFVTILKRSGRGDHLTLVIRNLLTKSERIMVGRRIRIAKRLIAGKTYETIRAELNVGLATIARVDAWLFASIPHYKALLPKQDETDREDHREYVPPEPYSFEALRKKYPDKFLIFNLLLDGDKKK